MARRDTFVFMLSDDPGVVDFLQAASRLCKVGKWRDGEVPVHVALRNIRALREIAKDFAMELPIPDEIVLLTEQYAGDSVAEVVFDTVDGVYRGRFTGDAGEPVEIVSRDFLSARVGTRRAALEAGYG